MKHVSILILLFLTALFSACSDDEMGGNGKPREGILLTLTNGALANTKAPALSSTANLHHVTDVYAVLYQLNADKSDGTFKLCKQLPWNPMDSAEYAIDQVQFYQFWFSEENEARNLPAGNYRILCIGLDNQLPTPKPDQQKSIDGESWPDNLANYHTSGATYNLPEAIKDKPLSQALATLAEGKTQEDIAHSELFAGWTDFDYMPGELSDVKVEMKRRVAGVICYLTDIPYMLTYSNGSYRVTGVRLCLCQPQNKQIALCRVESQPDADATTMVAADYGSEPFAEGEGSEILAEHTFYQDAGNGELQLKVGYEKQANENLYRIENKAYGRLIKENSILMGAYLLPVERLKNVAGATLTVQLMGRPIADTGQDSGSNLDANTEEVVIRTLPALNSELVDGEDESQYNIHPNYIYQIGRKPTPALSQDEYPESLEGNRLFLRVKTWTKEEIPVEFPEVPIYATMEFDEEGMNMDCMGTAWYDKDPDYTDFPFDKTEEIEYHKLHITPSLLGKPWKLVIEGDGLYVRTTQVGNPLEELFSKTYEPDSLHKPFDLDLLLEDYIVERDYEHDPKYKGLNIADDYRTFKIKLYTYADEQMTEPIYEDSLSLKQYNAITVKSENGTRFFARYDVGTEQFASGSYTSEYRCEWAYDGIVATEVLGVWENDHSYYGLENYIDARREKDDKYNSHPAEFYKSAIRHGARKRVVLQDVGSGSFQIKKQESEFWYLPAYYELLDFLNLPKKVAPDNPEEAVKRLNLNTYDNYGTEEQKTSIYWTSTPRLGWIHLSYAFYITPQGTVSDELRRNRNEKLFIRQACQLTGNR